MREEGNAPDLTDNDGKTAAQGQVDLSSSLAVAGHYKWCDKTGMESWFDDSSAVRELVAEIQQKKKKKYVQGSPKWSWDRVAVQSKGFCRWSLSEHVMATVKPGAAGGEPAFWVLVWAFCRWAGLQQRNVWLCHVFLLLTETNTTTA